MDDIRVARGLGWFSIGLGLVQLFAPRRLGRMLGVGDHRGLFRFLGLREILTGIGILRQKRPATGVWGRVAGDLMDVTLLARALSGRHTQQRRVLGGTAMVLAIGLIDFLCARSLQNR